MNISDEQIIGLLRSDSKAGMKALYAKHVGGLTALCSRYLADSDDVKDILQEVFIKAFTQWQSFAYKGEGSLKAWLARITVNMSINFLKTAGRIPVVRDDRITDNIAEDDTATDADADGVPPDALQEMIKSLPDGYRTVLNLYIFENKSHKEIAETLNIKPASSASQLFHAKAMMARKISEYKRSH